MVLSWHSHSQTAPRPHWRDHDPLHSKEQAFERDGSGSRQWNYRPTLSVYYATGVKATKHSCGTIATTNEIYSIRDQLTLRVLLDMRAQLGDRTEAQHALRQLRLDGAVRVERIRHPID